MLVSSMLLHHAPNKYVRLVRSLSSGLSSCDSRAVTRTSTSSGVRPPCESNSAQQAGKQ